MAFCVAITARAAWLLGVLVLMVYLIFFAMTRYLLPPRP